MSKDLSPLYWAHLHTFGCHLCYKNYQKNLRDVSDDTKIFVSLNAKCLGGIVKKYKNENRQLPQKLVARKDLKRAIKHREMTAYYLIKRG